jgi:hypothetical protein
MQLPRSKEGTKQTPATILTILAIWLVIVLGCGDIHVPSGIYWTNACVTPDKSALGVGGHEAVLIDLKTGEIKKRVEKFFGTAVCLPKGDVLNLATNKAVWLTTDKQIDGKFDWGLIGPLDDERLVGAFRSSEQKDASIHYLKPLQVVVSNLNSAAQYQKQISLDSSLFPGVKGYEFRTIGIRLLQDKRLLVAAGEKPPVGALAHPKTPWGFFTVDIEKETVAPFGEIITSDDDVNLVEPASAFDATSDGKTIAGVFGSYGVGNPKTLAAFVSGKEISRRKLENVDNVSAISLNEDGSLLAIGISEKGFEVGRIEVIDLRGGGKPLWTSRTDSPTSYLKFLNDDSLVFMTQKRGLSRRNGKTGAVMWEIKEQD